MVFIVFREGSRIRWRISCQQGIRRRLRMVKCYAPSGHNVNINEHLGFKTIKTSMNTLKNAGNHRKGNTYSRLTRYRIYLGHLLIIQHPMQILSQHWKRREATQKCYEPPKPSNQRKFRSQKPRNPRSQQPKSQKVKKSRSHRKPPKATDARATTPPQKNHYCWLNPKYCW